MPKQEGMRLIVSFLFLLVTSPTQMAQGKENVGGVVCHLPTCFADYGKWEQGRATPVLRRGVSDPRQCRQPKEILDATSFELPMDGLVKSVTTPTVCQRCGNITRTSLPAQTDALKAAAKAALRPPEIKADCIARSMQRSQVARDVSRLIVCPSANAPPVRAREPQPLCPTPQLVNYLQSWTNQALACLNPKRLSAQFNQDLDIDAELMFALMNHESQWNKNVAGTNGTGLMQITEVVMRGFMLQDNGYLSRYWAASRDQEECKPFQQQMDSLMNSNFREVRRHWRCSITAPQATGRHLVIGISNLMHCARVINDVMREENWKGENISTIRSAQKPEDRQAEMKKVRRDLMAVCHNWGAGGMSVAFRSILKVPVTNAMGFRSQLESNGWSKTSIKSTNPQFASKVEEDLEMIKSAQPGISNAKLESCVL